MDYSWRDIHISFNKKEAEDLLWHLDECCCEAYIQTGDPAYTAICKLKEKLQELDEIKPETTCKCKDNYV